MLRRLLRDTKALSTLEFALVLPVLFILYAGTVEIVNFIYAQQKLQSAVENIVKVIGQMDALTASGQTSKMAGMIPSIVYPYDIKTSEYKLFITTMIRDADEEFPGDGRVYWQSEHGGFPGASAFPDSNCPDGNQIVSSSQLNGFVFNPGDQIIIVEAWMKFESVFMDSLSFLETIGLGQNEIYYKSAPMRPRIGYFITCPRDRT